MSVRIGVVGASGLVGQEVIGLISELDIECEEIRKIGSYARGEILEIGPDVFDGLNYVIFCAGRSVSLKYAPVARDRGCVVIDNSSAYRMDERVPLIVPEINGELLFSHEGIVANPNCSTTIAMMGLWPLHREFGLKRFIATTYQAVSGSGRAGVRDLEEQTRGWVNGKVVEPAGYEDPIGFNVFAKVGACNAWGYSEEEMKMEVESRKIMGISDLRVSTTCVRVPVWRAHSIAIHAEFEKEVDLGVAREVLEGFEGVVYDENPMPIKYSSKQECGVGRLRRDRAFENGMALWVVGDQLWKGAALNALQILMVLEKSLVFLP